MFWVYVLQNPKGRFYIGQTEDLPARLVSHNDTTSIDGHEKKWSMEARLEGATCYPGFCRQTRTGN